MSAVSLIVQPCADFNTRSCAGGSNCAYLHGPDSFSVSTGGRNVCLAFLAKLHCAGCNYSHERHDVATLDDDELAPTVQQKLQEIQSWFTRTQQSVDGPSGYYHQQPPCSAETQEQAKGSTSSFANTDPSKVVEFKPRGLQLPMPTSSLLDEETASSIMGSTEGNVPSDATGGSDEDGGNGWTPSSSAAGSVRTSPPPHALLRHNSIQSLLRFPSPIEALSSPLFPFLRSPDYRPPPNFFLRQRFLNTRPLDSSPTSVRGAYATFISDDNYLPGALVLAYCHQLVRSEYPFIILATSSLSQHARAIITKAQITLIDTESLVPVREQYDTSVTGSRFRETWTKLRVFEQIQYERIILMNSDMIICKNMDELFTLPLGEDEIAATYVCACNPRGEANYPPDWTPSNCAYTSLAYPACLEYGQSINTRGPRPYRLLNSGLVVLHPSISTFERIKAFLDTSPLIRGFIFPDQDLLAVFFQGKWRPLPFIYNALKTSRDIHTNIWKDDADIKCLYYISEDKPWKVPPNMRGTSPDASHDTTNLWWWDKYYSLVMKMRASGMEVEARYLGTLIASRI